MRYNHFDMLPERAFLKVGGRITLEGGGGGGPSSTQTTGTTYQTNIPEYAQPYVTTMLNATQQQLFNMNDQGQITGFNPYRAYGGTYDASGNMISYDPSKAVAGFSPLQTQAQTAAGALETPGQFAPATGMAMGAGLGSLGISGRATGAGADYARMATDPRSVEAYMSPYMRNVVDYQKSQALRDYSIGEGMRKAQAVGQGAFGGSRQAIAQAEAERTLKSQLQGIEAQGAQSAFDKAQQAQQFGANLGLQGYQTGLQGLAQAGAAAGQLGQLGTSELAAQKDIINLQAQQGAAQQAYQQQILNQAIQDYANAQQYPLMQLGTMSNMLRGLPMQAASTQQYVAQANPTTQAIGTIGSLGSLYGAFGGYGGTSTGKAKGGILSVKKMAKGGIASYDIGGAVEADLYDMPMERLQKELQSPSAEIRKKAKRIMAEKSIEGKAGGGIIAFARPTEENNQSLVEEPETATDVRYAPNIKGGRPTPPAPAPEKPMDLSTAGIMKLGAQQYQDIQKQANRPIEEIAAQRAAYIGPDAAGQRYRESVMAEKANADDEFRRQNWLRAAQIFADWGSQPGNTLVAGMNALKGRVGDLITDRQEQKKYMREIDKIIYGLDKADRDERAGNFDKAFDEKNRLGAEGYKMFGHLSDLAGRKETADATRAAAATRSSGAGTGDKSLDRWADNLRSANDELKKLKNDAEKDPTLTMDVSKMAPDSPARKQIEQKQAAHAAAVSRAQADFNLAKQQVDRLSGGAPTSEASNKPEQVTVGGKTYARPAGFTDTQWADYKKSVGAK